MATIPINDTAPRIAYTATSGQTVFPYPFWISAEEDIVVYQNGTALTLTTHYTVSDVLEPTGGNITFVTGATLNDEIVIVRDIPVKRVSEFQTGGSFQASVLNSSLSKQVAMIQQVETNQARSLQLNASDTFSGDMNLPQIVSGKYLRVKDDGTGWEMGNNPVTNTAISTAPADAHKIISVNSAGDDFDKLASVGTSGQILTSNGSGSAPTWQTPSSTNGSFHAILSANQSINHTVHTKIQFNTEIYDVNGDFDATTNYDFTPSVAGKYFIYTQVRYGNPLVADRYSHLYIYKNGASVAQSTVTHPNDDPSTIVLQSVIDFNGTTDYVSVYTYHNNGVTENINGHATVGYSCFGGIRVA